MLLRSASHPIQKSWLPHSKDTSPESDQSSKIRRTRSGNHLPSLSMSHTQNSFSSSPSDEYNCPSMKRMGRTSSETDLCALRSTRIPPKISRGLSSVSVEEDMEVEDPGFESGPTSALSRILSSAGLEGLMTAVDDECCVLDKKDSGAACSTLVFGGGCGSGGGKICGGGGNGGGGSDGGDGDGGFGPSDSDNGNKSMDAYYQKMIKADPGNPLLLGNYSKFLKEVQCNLEKAEHYCGRAILANPTDASNLALYGDLIWQSDKDAPRAESYFERAIQADPDDCYVMGSYARFMWDVEDEEEEEEVEIKENEFGKANNLRCNSPPPFFHGASFPPPVAAT
ncbi:hypothetical protein QJS10_CPB14g01069 [Acorus calamus]|uniref:Uncharacterized protein n=1 Tax=Acorus calamus TaxID=4465 RepID=A0AAV9DBF2_ACOCL|nr:hypothetical protein QJS10_CPB14g01069 [Acorus calamus]